MRRGDRTTGGCYRARPSELAGRNGGGVKVGRIALWLWKRPLSPTIRETVPELDEGTNPESESRQRGARPAAARPPMGGQRQPTFFANWTCEPRNRGAEPATSDRVADPFD
jgi:hypothetical protein